MSETIVLSGDAETDKKRDAIVWYIGLLERVRDVEFSGNSEAQNGLNLMIAVQKAKLEEPLGIVGTVAAVVGTGVAFAKGVKKFAETPAGQAVGKVLSEPFKKIKARVSDRRYRRKHGGLSEEEVAEIERINAENEVLWEKERLLREEQRKINHAAWESTHKQKMLLQSLGADVGHHIKQGRGYRTPERKAYAAEMNNLEVQRHNVLYSLQNPTIENVKSVEDRFKKLRNVVEVKYGLAKPLPEKENEMKTVARKKRTVARSAAVHKPRVAHVVKAPVRHVPYRAAAVQPEKKVNPMLIGGIALAAFLLLGKK